MSIKTTAPTRRCAAALQGRLLTLAAVLSLSGCSGGEKLPTVPVSGTVTYNGAPLEGAEVSLLPTQDGGRGAAGATDAQGQFQLHTYLGGTKTVDGAIPGDYTVTVRKREDTTALLRASMTGGGGPQGEQVIQEALKDAPPPQPSAPPGSGGRPGPGGGPPGRGAPPGGGAPPPDMMRGVALQGKSLIPEKYERAAESGLSATVKPSGNEPLKFDLAD